VKKEPELNSKEDKADSADNVDLSALVVPLLKGVIYQEQDPRQWHGLLNLQARVRDYVAVLSLDLVLDEAEGYAFLRSKPEADEVNEVSGIGTAPEKPRPRLVARRQLSFPVSLLLALLRKKLAEFDAIGDTDGNGTRLVLARNDMVELLRVFLPETSNEAKLIDQIDTHLSKVVDLGFLRRLKVTAVSGKSQSAASFEVCRILKAFVDAQWLADFDARLAQYLTLTQSSQGAQGAADE
jgi:hypothetical protein